MVAIPEVPEVPEAIIQVVAILALDILPLDILVVVTLVVATLVVAILVVVTLVVVTLVILDQVILLADNTVAVLAIFPTGLEATINKGHPIRAMLTVESLNNITHRRRLNNKASVTLTFSAAINWPLWLVDRVIRTL